jgi:hypothetical protein
MSRFQLLAAPAALCLLLAACASDSTRESREPTTHSYSMGTDRSGSSGSGECGLRTAMRKLWTEHVVWTRVYVMEAVAGSPGVDASAKRLLRNQQELGEAIVPYYGKEAGRQLASLLTDHITIATEVVDAAKAGADAKLKDADRRWHDNAAEIAGFLAGANPHWDRDEVTSMMNDHLRLTTNEAVNRLQKRWADDVANYDQIFEQAMHMADGLTDGIVKQFPDKFR